jgi:hypothetical protein
MAIGCLKDGVAKNKALSSPRFVSPRKGIEYKWFVETQTMAIEGGGG